MLIVDYNISEDFQRELMIVEGGTQRRERQFKTADRITDEISSLGSFDQADNLIIKLDYPIDFLISTVPDVTKSIKIQEEAQKFQQENQIINDENNLKEQWEKTIKILHQPMNLSFAPTLYIKQDWQKITQELKNGTKLSTRYYFGVIKDEYKTKEELVNLVQTFNEENKEIATQSLSEEIERRNSLLEEETKRFHEIQEWIEKHGSVRLKLMLENEYDLDATYELERGQKELSECDYNINNTKYTYTKKSNPSIKALELAEEYKLRGYRAEVVAVNQDNEAISIEVPWAQFNFIELI